MKDHKEQACNIIILGASGDLSKRKLLPALFALYCNGMLPHDTRVYGYARSKMDDQQFREKITANLNCRYTPDSNDCAEKMETFLKMCFYQVGQYDSIQDFTALNERMAKEKRADANHLFYMSIPPDIFIDTSCSIGGAGLMDVPDGFWSRVVLEKPFGRDSKSSAILMKTLKSIFDEESTYRIDHYLGKEVIQNLMTLRFANLIFEPVWNRNYIDWVSIAFSEDIGCEGRAGYFDNFGIMRDVLQNHILQIVALVGMEAPVSLDAKHIADEKVKLLASAAAITAAETIVGQYIANTVDGEEKPGYLDDDEVPEGSITETYAHTIMHINNPRWSGVPFYLSAGKALDTRKTEIQIQFKDLPYSIFNGTGKENPQANKLVIRVQPNEAIELHVTNKVPGMGMEMEDVKLDMLYHDSFDEELPDAYERLLLDVIRGDRSLFLQDEELRVGWDIVTPLLHQLEKEGKKPVQYPYGQEPEHGCPA
ncbi:MAG: glucose-6-phosphate dehydrogenase [Lentisphaeria bacterium]|nr:glucose-6-phosphate dehydrogenase [Lentisphaeria bacterium]NQZ67512.1 glucose-6-phosphate dehydrogenase [Lentisphaeria bacterium]